MDSFATFIGYGVIILGIVFAISKVFEAQEAEKGKERYEANLFHELALHDLYWSAPDEKSKEAIKAFAMGPGFTGWSLLVLPDDEFRAFMDRLGHSHFYYKAKARLDAEGSPYRLEGGKVRPAKGDRFYLPLS